MNVTLLFGIDLLTWSAFPKKNRKWEHYLYFKTLSLQLQVQVQVQERQDSVRWSIT